MQLVNLSKALAAMTLALALLGTPLSTAALAQTAPSSQPPTAVLSASTLKALQEALVRQGISVKADGVLNDETRAAIRKYQSQHHLPVTGEPDKATLDKLGVAGSQTATPSSQQSTTQAPGSPQAQSQSGMMGVSQQQNQMAQGATMMNCPMMQGSMHNMMQGSMHNMMQGSMHNMMQMMDRMQTMQGMMMQMMQAMMQSGQMQSGQMQPGQMQPGQMQPGQMQPGQMQPGQMQPGAR